MTPSPITLKGNVRPRSNSEVQGLTKMTAEHFNLHQKELCTDLEDYSDYIKMAIEGDTSAAKRILQHARAELMKNRPPNPEVCEWLSRRLFLIIFEGVDANHALGIRKKTGRSNKGPDQLGDLHIWEKLECLRLEGFSLVEAATEYHFIRLEEHNNFPEYICSPPDTSTLLKMRRRGEKLVLSYLEQTQNQN